MLFWLGVAVSVAVLAQVAKAFQDYFTRLAVKKFGMQIFNDGLRQTLRLSYNEFEEQRSGETLSGYTFKPVPKDPILLHEVLEGTTAEGKAFKDGYERYYDGQQHRLRHHRRRLALCARGAA